jgi:hypothetical protein
MSLIELPIRSSGDDFSFWHVIQFLDSEFQMLKYLTLQKAVVLQV